MPADAQDAEWNWDRWIDLARSTPKQYEVYALEAAGDLQGLRVLEVPNDEKGVHALRLSTAPWNRQSERRYRGVGSILVGIAILRSIEMHHNGRVYCESLPDAEKFHKNNGIEEFNGLSPEGLRQYRFTPENAEGFLTRIRDAGLIQ
jgi:hypothetical protein